MTDFGKWSVSGDATIRSERGDICYLARNTMPSPELRACTSLIAAAPDLLEALERLVANVDEGDFISTTRIDAAYAAIKKAKGQ